MRGTPQAASPPARERTRPTRAAQRLALLCAALALPHAATASVQLAVVGGEDQPAADVVVTIEAAGAQRVRPAVEPVVIQQQSLRFVPALTVAPLGTTLSFLNRDTCDQYVRSLPSGPLGAVAPTTSFEFRLGPGDSRRNVTDS